MDKSLHTDAHLQLAEILRTARTDAGLTQVELAGRLGRPQSLISDYENGQRRLDLVELRTIAHALDTTLADIVDRFEQALPPEP